MNIRQCYRYYSTTKISKNNYITGIYTSLVKNFGRTCEIEVWYSDDPYIRDYAYNTTDNLINTLDLPMPDIKNYYKIPRL